MSYDYSSTFLSIDEGRTFLVYLVQLTSNQLGPTIIWKKVINLILAVSINIILSLILILVAFWLPQLNVYAEKASPYECGFDPISSARLPFSIKFFLVAITFLLFDLEIALLLPLPWAIQSTNLKTTLIISTIFLSILALGLAYEWKQKGLEWTE